MTLSEPMNELKSRAFFDSIPQPVRQLFDAYDYPWEVIPHIHDHVLKLIANSRENNLTEHSDGVWMGRGTTISHNAVIMPPCLIGEGCEIRPGAYIRGNVIIGNDCVIGNSTEIKNSILFDRAQLPHYNYVGDSIIGNHSHLGAGAVCSNQKQDKRQIYINGDERITTGLRKLGAIIADNVEIGCGAVLNPGTIIRQNAAVYPLVSVRGIIPRNVIVKSSDIIIEKSCLDGMHN